MRIKPSGQKEPFVGFVLDCGMKFKLFFGCEIIPDKQIYYRSWRFITFYIIDTKQTLKDSVLKTNVEQ